VSHQPAYCTSEIMPNRQSGLVRSVRVVEKRLSAAENHEARENAGIMSRRHPGGVETMLTYAHHEPISFEKERLCMRLCGGQQQQQQQQRSVV
jgi:hypothetical protein